jgi:hypothetical protein
MGELTPQLSMLEKAGLLGQVLRAIVVSPRPYDTDSVGWTVCRYAQTHSQEAQIGYGRYSGRCDCWKDGGLAKQKKTRMPTSRNV